MILPIFFLFSHRITEGVTTLNLHIVNLNLRDEIALLFNGFHTQL